MILGRNISEEQRETNTDLYWDEDKVGRWEMGRHLQKVLCTNFALKENREMLRMGDVRVYLYANGPSPGGRESR